MDFVKDQNPKPIYLADELVGLPEYVKTASQILPDDLVNLADVAFGVPSLREYPVHTKEATWLSAAYAMGSGAWHADAHLEQTVRKAAALHEIEPDLQKLEDAFAAQNKQASAPTPRFALSVDFGDTAGLGLQHFYEINDPYQITKAARDMVNDLSDGRLRIEFFQPAAVELIKAARSHDMDLGDIHMQVRCLGEERLPDFESALQVAELRKSAGVPEEAIELYKEAARGAQTEPEQIPRWLDLWLDMDATYGVKYSSHQPDPFQAFFAGDLLSDIDKAASEMVLINDVLIPASVLPAVTEDAVRKNFRKEAADKLAQAIGCAVQNPSQATQIFDSLPRGTNKEFLTLVLAAA
jgi:hypothetical protein